MEICQIDKETNNIHICKSAVCGVRLTRYCRKCVTFATGAGETVEHPTYSTARRAAPCTSKLDMVFLLQEKRIQLARAQGRAWHFSLGGHGLTKIDSATRWRTHRCGSAPGPLVPANTDRSIQRQTSCRTFATNPGPTPHRVQRESSADTAVISYCVPAASARWKKLSIPVPAPLKSSPYTLR